MGTKAAPLVHLLGKGGSKKIWIKAAGWWWNAHRSTRLKWLQHDVVVYIRVLYHFYASRRAVCVSPMVSQLKIGPIEHSLFIRARGWIVLYLKDGEEMVWIYCINQAKQYDQLYWMTWWMNDSHHHGNQDVGGARWRFSPVTCQTVTFRSSWSWFLDQMLLQTTFHGNIIPYPVASFRIISMTQV